MSSDELPSLEGLRGFRAKAGALETWRFFKFGPDTTMGEYMANAFAMLGPDGSMAEIEALSDKFNERETIKPNDVLKYCIDATGARPDPSDDADRAASMSFALFVHICAERPFMSAVASDETKVKSYYILGRIAEWWRWRSTGLDKAARVRTEAVASLNSGANEGRREINARRKKAAARWEIAAREIAAVKWREKPNLSASAMAPHVRKELSRTGIVSATGWTPSVDRIRRTIGPYRPK